MADGVIEVGTARAEPGETVRGAIPVMHTAGGGAVEIPLAVINGVKPGPVLWVDGAIHGDEPEGPLCCQILLREVSAADLAGTLVLVPAMNVPAFEAATSRQSARHVQPRYKSHLSGTRGGLFHRARRARACKLADEGGGHGDIDPFRRQPFVPRPRDVRRRAAGIQWS